jgi:DivIVA domain-containing protein
MTDDRFRLTALDARRWDFGNALRGYDRSRVDEFREQVAEELERLARQSQELETKANNFLEQLRVFRERDKALNEALVSAQQLRGEIRGQAEREAQLIIREARTEAERIIASVEGEVKRAQDELAQLARSRKSFIAQMRALIEKQAMDLAAADDAGSSASTSSASTSRASASDASATGASRADASAYTPLAAVPPRASLNPTQAFPIPAVPAPAVAGDDHLLPDPAARDAESTGADSGSFRLTIDTSAPRTPPVPDEAALPPSRPSMPTPSWLDAVDEEERS